jgi:hypothetical protein
LARPARLELPPAALSAGPEHALFARLKGRSAHSDTAVPFLAAARAIPDVALHRLHLDPYPCVVASIGGRAFAFVEGMQGVTLRLDARGSEAAVARGALPQAELGPGWVLLPLFGSRGFEADLHDFLRRAAADAIA